MKRIGLMRQIDVAAPEVAAIFAAYPSRLRARLLALRRLILDTAASTEGVGALCEMLRWRQPSYLTDASESGTTIRIDVVNSDVGRYGLLFNCQTDLVETFRRLYPDLSYAGNRAVVFDLEGKVPQQALRHCIALALTYHRRNKTR
jgi:hypothetical protein